GAALPLDERGHRTPRPRVPARAHGGGDDPARSPRGLCLLPRARGAAASGGDRDIVSLIANGQVNGAPLAPVELLSYYFLLLVGGNETTRNAMTGGLLAFLEHPGEWQREWQRLRTDPALLDTAVEEIVRWTTPVIQFARTATRDYTLRGATIRKTQF